MVRVVAILCILAGMSGCKNEGTAPDAALPDATESTAKAFELLDANADGLLSAEEISGSPGLMVGATRIDANGDGDISRDEFEEYFSLFAEAGTRITALYGTQVIYDGQPLSGVAVTLQPEPFLDGAVKPAQGVTDENGYCEVTAEGFNYDGVQTGFYRVLFSMQDGAGQEMIPARYNTESTIGIEVSDAAVEIEGGIIWELYSR